MFQSSWERGNTTLGKLWNVQKSTCLEHFIHDKVQCLQVIVRIVYKGASSEGSGINR